MELEQQKGASSTDVDALFDDFLNVKEFGKALDDSDDEDAAPRAEKIFTKRGAASKKASAASALRRADGESSEEGESVSGDEGEQESLDSYYDDENSESAGGIEGSVGDSAEMDSDNDSQVGFESDEEAGEEEDGEFESGDGGIPSYGSTEEQSGDDGSEDEMGVESHEEIEEEESEETESAPKTDIYGRPLASSTTAAVPGKYIPPHLRNKAGAPTTPQYDEKTAAMRKELRGLINRLSEPNLTKIATAIESLLSRSSRGTLSEGFAEFLCDDCIASTGSRVFSYALPYSALAFLLHTVIGAEIGGILIEKIAREFSARIAAREIAVCKNLAHLLMYLYSFKVIHHSLIYDLIQIVVERFEDGDIEILLLLVKGAGQQLRADDPAALRDTVTSAIKRASEIRSKAAATPAKPVSADSGVVDGDIPAGLTRSDYLLELLSDLKNNKLKFQDRDVASNVQRVKRLVDSFLRERFKSAVPSPQHLKIRWADLVGSSSKGRWWLGGNFSAGLEPSAY